MTGVALSADDIQNAPPEVRRWLERQFLGAATEEPTPKAAIGSSTSRHQAGSRRLKRATARSLQSLMRKGVLLEREGLK